MPNSSGRWLNGVAKVASIRVLTRWRLADLGEPFEIDDAVVRIGR